jgi:hypothetical protein
MGFEPADGEHASLRIRMRSWTTRRDPHHCDARTGQDRIERGGEPAARSRTRKANSPARPPSPIMRSRARRVLQGPSGGEVVLRMPTQRVPTSRANNAYNRRKVTAQPT